MTVALTLTRMGGCARGKDLQRLHSDRAIAKAVRKGNILRVGRGRYTLPATDDHRRVAHALTGEDRARAPTGGLPTHASPEEGAT